MSEQQTDSAFVGWYGDPQSGTTARLVVGKLADVESAERAIQEAAEKVTNSTIRVELVEGIGDGTAYRITTPEVATDQFAIDASMVVHLFRVRGYFLSIDVMGSKQEFDRNADLAAALVQAEIEMARVWLEGAE
jgi:hypothetical protein